MPLAACARRWRGLAKIGLVLTFRGGNPAAAERVQLVFQEALIARNRGAGLDGRRLELVTYDDEGGGQAAWIRVEALALDPEVVLVVLGGSADGRVAATEQRLPFVELAHFASAEAATERILLLLSEAAGGGGLSRADVARRLASG